MDLPKGFHNEVIDARENKSTSSSIKKNIATHPLKTGGSNFKTHKLVKKTPWKYEYKTSIGGFIFATLFIIIGLGVLTYNLKGIILRNQILMDINWFLILFGSVFMTAGILILYFFAQPRVFDKKINLYYKTYKKTIRNKKIKKNQIPLNEIVALQIIGEHVEGDNNTYKSFELNLVVSDGTRRNVVDHGNLKSIINDARELETFLEVPIWHATSHLED